MEFLLGYGAGLLTLINPCVLPILPIVLATALQASPRGPIALAAGMSLAFVTLGLLVTAFGYAIGLTEDTVANAAALLMVGFGLILLIPRLSAGFATATGGFASGADARIDTLDQNNLRGQFLGGMLLGAVWSPCVGPTLGGAISLASQGESLPRAALVMLSFALGISTVMLGLAYGARSALQRRKAAMQALATRARPILGVTFIVVGLSIYFRFHQIAEAWLIEHMPIWLQDLSVIL